MKLFCAIFLFLIKVWGLEECDTYQGKEFNPFTMDFFVVSQNSSQLFQAPKLISFVFPENGSLYEHQLSQFVSPVSLKEPSAIMKLIEQEHGIPMPDQIILRGNDGKQMETSTNLREYFEKDRVLYIFNTTSRDEPISEDFEVICPLGPGRNEWNEIGLESLSGLYEKLFQTGNKGEIDPSYRIKLEEIMTTFCDVRNEIRLLKDGAIKLQRQKESEAVVKSNLMGYYVDKKRKFDGTFAQMKAKVNGFQKLIGEFDSCLENLGKIEVDAQLNEKGTKYLIDFFDVNKAQNNKATYKKNQEKILQKCDEMEAEIIAYDEQLKKIEENLPDHYSQVSSQIQEQEETLLDIYNAGIKRFHEIVVDQYKELSATDFTAFANKEWEMTIANIREIFQNLKQVRAQIEGYLRDNAQRLRNFVSDVANIQLIIRGKLSNKHTVFRSLLEKHEKDIFNLEIIAEFPNVYQASVDEIQRRYRSKKDCLAILKILENFVTGENNSRKEFSKKYSAYLPKTFCPMLAKGFPNINFEYLHKVVNQEESFLVKESSSNDAKTHEAGEVLRLLKSFGSNIETKDAKILELENTLRLQNEEIKKSREELKPNNFDKDDISRYLGSINFQEQVDSAIRDVTKKCNEQILSLTGRIDTLQTEKVDALEQMLGEVAQEIRSEIPEGEKKSLKELLKEMRRIAQDRFERLGVELEKKEVEKNQVLIDLRGRESELERLEEEKEALVQEKIKSEEAIAVLTDRVVGMEIVEHNLEQINSYLRKNSEANQEMISSLMKDLETKEIEAKALALEMENQNQLHNMTSDVIDQNNKTIAECKNQIGTLWEKLAENENQTVSLQKKLAIERDLVQVLLQKNDQLEKLISEKDKMLANDHEALMEKEFKVADLMEKLSKNEDALIKAERTLCIANLNLDYLVEQQAEQTHKIEKLAHKNEQLLSEKNNVLKEMGISESEVKALEEEDFAHLILRKVQELDTLNHEYEVMKNTREEAQNEVKTLQGERQEMKSALETQNTQNQELAFKVSILEDGLAKKNQEINRLQSVIEEISDAANSYFSRERISNQEAKNAQNSEPAQANNTESKEMVNMSVECDMSQNVLTNTLLADFGEAVLTLYTTLLGSYAEETLSAKSMDLKEIILEIPKLVRSFMVKIQGLDKGDKVIGVKVAGSKSLYQIVHKDIFNIRVLYLFKAKEEYGDIIIGDIRSLEYMMDNYEESELLKNCNFNGILNVELAAIEEIDLTKNSK